MASRIEYSEKYMDDKHEYRHVILPKELARSLPKQRCVGAVHVNGLWARTQLRVCEKSRTRPPIPNHTQQRQSGC